MSHETNLWKSMEKPDHHLSQAKDSKATKRSVSVKMCQPRQQLHQRPAQLAPPLCHAFQNRFSGRFAAEIGRNRQPGVDLLRRLQAQKPEHIEGIGADEHHVGAIF